MRTILVPTICAVLCASCGTTRSGARWGDGATLRPGGDRILRAARDAALDPWTWVPAAGGLAFAVGSWDDEVSEWARREKPVFGDQDGALDAADDLRTVARYAWIASMIATPGGDEAGPWARSKAGGVAVEWAATFATKSVTSGLKSIIDRTPPDGSDREGFPSGHVTDAFASAALARRNLESIEMHPAVRGSLHVGLAGVAAGTAWARVEAGHHRPSDVLGSAAIGNFVARFVHDAFLGLPDGVQLTGSFDPGGESWSLGLAFSF